jgi:hypothetical protein
MVPGALRRGGRKLLIASIGVATVTYVGTNCGVTSVANLQAPPSCDVAPTNPYCTGGNSDAGGDADADQDAADTADADTTG